MQRYESYKPSAIPWIDKLPQHWGEEKGKWLHRFRKELNARKQCDNVLSLTLRGVVNNDPDDPEGLVPKDYGTYQIFEKDDLVFKLIDLENFRTSRVGLVHERGIMSPAYLRVQPGKEHNPRYFYYYYFTLYQQGIYNKLGAGVRSTLGPTDLLEIGVPLPPKDEQDRIVAFLDQKTAEIDAAIAKKERLIELLNEQLQTIIDKAVTAGLGGDQKLTECGLDWTPLCPSGWSIRKVSHYFRAQKGREAAKLTKEYCGTIPGPYPVYSGQTENNGVMSEISNYEFDAGESGVLFSTTVGAKAMSVMHLTGRFSLSQNCMIIKPTSKEIIARFFFYQFQRIFFYYRGLIPDHMQASFRMEDLYRYCFLLPPVTEQIEIANHLDEKSAEINRAINVTRVQIERLQELRRALIAEAVTGQINIQKVTKDG